MLKKLLNRYIGGIERVRTKLKVKCYCFLHPFLKDSFANVWGVPTITHPENLTLGNNVIINEGVFLQCDAPIFIGNRCTISRNTTILTAGLDTKQFDVADRHRDHIFKPVTIFDGVWIGANSIVTPGVTIAPRIIIGAGSVVTKDLEKEGWLYAGVPAKAIKPLD